jgi:protein involved in sex pheromone biosynthesis
MNTRKIFFGLATCAVLMIAGCTSESDDLYESGVDKRHVRVSNKDANSVDKRHVRSSNKQSVDKRHVRSSNKENN